MFLNQLICFYDYIKKKKYFSKTSTKNIKSNYIPHPPVGNPSVRIHMSGTF